MGMTRLDDLYESPLGGALWETAAFSELSRLLNLHRDWQLYYWRDRTKEADFLLHRAGRFKIADSKWAEHPTKSGKLEKVKRELPEGTEAALFCRTEANYMLSDRISALGLADVAEFLKMPGKKKQDPARKSGRPDRNP